jgi:hypothetical protein
MTGKFQSAFKDQFKDEPSREELRLQKRGMHPLIHSIEAGAKNAMHK